MAEAQARRRVCTKNARETNKRSRLMYPAIGWCHVHNLYIRIPDSSTTPGHVVRIRRLYCFFFFPSTRFCRAPLFPRLTSRRSKNGPVKNARAFVDIQNRNGHHIFKHVSCIRTVFNATRIESTIFYVARFGFRLSIL